MNGQKHIPLQDVKKYDRFIYHDSIIECLGVGRREPCSPSLLTMGFVVIRAEGAHRKNELIVIDAPLWDQLWRDNDIHSMGQARQAVLLDLLRDRQENPRFTRELFEALAMLWEYDSEKGQAETIELLREVLPKKLKGKLFSCDCHNTKSMRAEERRVPRH